MDWPLSNLDLRQCRHTTVGPRPSSLDTPHNPELSRRRTWQVYNLPGLGLAHSQTGRGWRNHLGQRLQRVWL